MKINYYGDEISVGIDALMPFGSAFRFEDKISMECNNEIIFDELNLYDICRRHGYDWCIPSHQLTQVYIDAYLDNESEEWELCIFPNPARYMEKDLNTEDDFMYSEVMASFEHYDSLNDGISFDVELTEEEKSILHDYWSENML